MPESPPLLDRIDEYLSYYASRQPESEAMVLGELRISYAEMQNRVDKIASALVAAGVRKDDRVATLSTPHPEFFLVFLATASIGAIWIGLNPRYRINELQYVIADSEPCLLFARTVVGGRSFMTELEQLKTDNNCLNDMVAMCGDLAASGMVSMDEFLTCGVSIETSALQKIRSAVNTMDPATIIYTSGTTGKPKGALLSHHGLCRVFRNQLPYWYAHPLSMLNYLPINHIGCLGDISCFMLIGGGKIVFMEKFDPAASMELVQNEQITVWGGVPTTMQMSIDLPDFEEYDLSSVQIIVFGGASPSENLVKALSHIGVPFSNTYGLTETTSTVTYVGLTRDIELIANTIGKPVPGYEIRLVDDNGKDVDPGQAGEILARGSFTLLRYWNRPESTAEIKDKDGWLHTGDMAKVREDGNFVFEGRKKEMFKSGGYNVYPLEVEAAIEQHPLVHTAIVVSIPDSLYAEVGCAFVKSIKGKTISSVQLKSHCKQILANYKVPKSFVVREALPVLAIGKVDRSALKAEALRLSA